MRHHAVSLRQHGILVYMLQIGRALNAAVCHNRCTTHVVTVICACSVFPKHGFRWSIEFCSSVQPFAICSCVSINFTYWRITFELDRVGSLIQLQNVGRVGWGRTFCLSDWGGSYKFDPRPTLICSAYNVLIISNFATRSAICSKRRRLCLRHYFLLKTWSKTSFSGDFEQYISNWIWT